MLQNVTIGNSSIIGAGSLVNKDIPSNSVAAGNPVRIISSLEDYFKKIETIRKEKKIFGPEYWIHNLNKTRQLEILSSIGDSIGFIE